jgi:hypothetical protein
MAIQESIETMTPQENKLALELEKLRLEVEGLKKPAKSFLKNLAEQWQATLVTIIVALLAIFPNYLVEKTKDALNRSDQRFTQFEELSMDLSEYEFNSQLVFEYYQNGWTTTNSLTPIVNDYNNIITKVRKREQLNRAVINRFWGKSYLSRFDSIMESVKSVDAGIHELNPEAERLVEGLEVRADPKIVNPILAQIKPKFDKLTRDLNEFLSSLM